MPDTVTVVNMIPRLSSGETHQDSEPNLAVNPANNNKMSIARGNTTLTDFDCGDIDLTGEPVLHGIFLNRHVSRLLRHRGHDARLLHDRKLRDPHAGAAVRDQFEHALRLARGCRTCRWR